MKKNEGQVGDERMAERKKGNFENAIIKNFNILKTLRDLILV